MRVYPFVLQQLSAARTASATMSFQQHVRRRLQVDAVTVHKTTYPPSNGQHYFCAMPFRHLTLLLIFWSTAFVAHSQHDSLLVSPGNVEFVIDSSIVKLEKGARKFKETKGYRLQIFLGPLETVKAERNKYLALGLPYSAYIKQIVPEHALQIGDFSNRLEMEKCRNEIEAYYPDALPVIEVIEPPKFNKRPKQTP